MRPSQHLRIGVALLLLSLPGVGLAQTALDDGIPESGLQGTQGSTQTFTLSVPSGTTDLRFTLEQGTGLASMTVNYGGGAAECTSTSDPCVFPNPPAGTWTVQLQGETGYTGATLTGWSLTELRNGDTVAGLSGAVDSFRWFYIDLPGAVDTLSVVTSGGTGDLTLTVVSAAAWESILNGSGGTFCTSEDPGTAESCARSKPRSGAWLVQLYGQTAYSGVTLAVDYEEGSGGALTPASLGVLLMLGVLPLRRRRLRGRSAPVP